MVICCEKCFNVFCFDSSYALVQVELKNQGGDAFKPDIYGPSITIVRRITESGSTIVLKDHQGLDLMLVFHVYGLPVLIYFNEFCLQ